MTQTREQRSSLSGFYATTSLLTPCLLLKTNDILRYNFLQSLEDFSGGSLKEP